MIERVGTLAWERAGGPPLTLLQRFVLLDGAARLIGNHVLERLRWLLGWSAAAPRVDLEAWRPPDTRTAREAEEFLDEVSSRPMLHHSMRAYYFAAVLAELSGMKKLVDREALYVAAVLHDVGLFVEPLRSEHCFTVASARHARRLMSEAGWDESLQDRVALAITSNLNDSVPMEVFGPEAYFLRVGGLVEVLAKQWRVHPENLADILRRHPRDNFADDALAHVDRERRRNPGCRFACLHPVFPVLVRMSRFSTEKR